MQYVSATLYVLERGSPLVRSSLTWEHNEQDSCLRPTGCVAAWFRTFGHVSCPSEQSLEGEAIQALPYAMTDQRPDQVESEVPELATEKAVEHT